MTLQDLLNMINQGGGSAGSTAASVSPSALSSVTNPGGALGGALGGAFGGNPSSGDASLGGNAGGLVGGIAGSALGPLGSLGGSAVGDLIGTLIGSLIGGGVPREAKTSAVGSALTGSGNPLDALVGQFVTKGANQGRVLSESGSSTFGQSAYDLADFLSALTGQQEPSVTASGFNKNPSFTAPALGKVASRLQIPAGYNFLSAANEPDAAKIIQQIVGIQQPAGSYPAQKADWQKVLQDLIAKGDLTRYQGTLGSPQGTTPTTPGTASTASVGAGTSSNPTIALPHPLAPPPVVQPPYPLQQAA